MPAASGSGSRTVATCPCGRGAWEDCVRRLVAVVRLGPSFPEGCPALRPRITLPSDGRASCDCVLPPEPAEHEYGETDGADDERSLQRSEKGDSENAGKS